MKKGASHKHIGAYRVEVKGKKITFLDTPWPRSIYSDALPGAQVTDLAVLVVAADDG